MPVLSSVSRMAVACMLLAAMQANAADASSSVDADGTTPLHWAAHDGDLAKVDALIRARADVNARNRFGSTPLYEAALAGNTEIIRAIVALAAGLGMDVTAEGIETMDQVDRLHELACEYGQGYYFNKPLTPEDARGILAGHVRGEPFTLPGDTTGAS